MTEPELCGFIGLGNMGSPMAGHLLEAGRTLSVFDLDQDAVDALVQRGASRSASVAELASAADVIFTALPGPPQVEAVALGEEGILANARPGSVYVDLSTNSPELIRSIHDAGRQRGVDVLDAAMSGGMHGAQSRRLSLMVGGDEQVAERLRPLLEAMSDNVVYCGASGAGTVTKIVNNLASLSESNLVGEALAMGVKWGVKLDTLASVMSASSSSSWRLNESFPRYVLAGNFRPGFALDLAVKDLELAQGLAEAAGGRADFLALSLSRYREAQDRGWGEQHSEAVVKLLEEQWGVRLRYADAPEQDIVP
ncbi:MAG: NAD(P)-dependent oxidoreductase [Solirubrobacteraceae bacterium]